MIKVQGFRILLKPEEIKKEWESSIEGLVKAETTKDSELRNVKKGKVLQVGADAYKSGEVRFPWCKVGDTVLINPQSGHNYSDDEGKWFIIVNEEDILAVIGD